MQAATSRAEAVPARAKVAKRMGNLLRNDFFRMAAETPRSLTDPMTEINPCADVSGARLGDEA